MPPLDFWKPGTKVKIKDTGEIAEVISYQGDGFYQIMIEDKGQAALYLNLPVEDLDLIEEVIELVTCPKCKGKGLICFMGMIAEDIVDVFHDICPECDGRGLVHEPEPNMGVEEYPDHPGFPEDEDDE